MLVRLIDTKGRTLWINPVHVKFMREKRTTTEIMMAATWASAPIAKIAMPMDEVAELFNAAMPDLSMFVPMDDDASAGGGSSAAAVAATG